MLIHTFVHASCCRLRLHAPALAVLTNTTARSHEHLLTLTDAADDADDSEDSLGLVLPTLP